jgi:hypothetical protein
MIRSGVTDFITAIVILPMPFIPIWAMMVSHKLVDELDRIFARSSFVQKGIAWMKTLGVAGAVMYCGSVFGLCINHRFCIRKGWVLEEEVLAVSVKIKKIMYPPFIACGVWTLLLTVCYLWIWMPIKDAR